MDGKSKYYRSFLVFKNEDTGFGEGREPTGYVKIEARDGKGKLNISLQNLKENPGKLRYKAYILKIEGATIVPVLIGNVNVVKNRAELQWEFNPDNVALSGIPIEKFDIAVILAEHTDRENLGIICPLAAYKEKKTRWKEGMEAALKPKNPDFKKAEDVIKNDDISSKYGGNLESKYYPIESPSEEAQAPSENENQEKDSWQDDGNYEEYPATEMPEAENEDFIEDNNTQEYTKAEDSTLFKATFGNDVSKDIGGGIPSGMPNFIGTGPYCSPGGTQTFCQQQMNPGMVNPCMNCPANTAKKDETLCDKSAATKMTLLKKNLNKFFLKQDPFNSKRRDYIWWKVENPVQLNNVLYQCNVRTPLLFNPNVMMAHFKYRHLIVGIYTDRLRSKEFLVCGVPAVQGIDIKPFGEMCRWTQMDGNKARYGAFGYWLVYMDVKTGKFISLS